MVIRYGVQLILEDRPKEVKEYTPAVLVIVFFGVLAGAQNMGLTSPHLEAFAVARGSAAAIFQVLDRVPTIDSLSKEGQKLPAVNGEIEFKNVHFQYPARKDVKVLQGLNLTINRGETVALVGGSGCGKSTCLQLIQRLYDPHKGQVSEERKIIIGQIPSTREFIIRCDDYCNALLGKLEGLPLIRKIITSPIASVS